MKEYIFPKTIKESYLASDLDSLLKKQPLQIGLCETKTATVSSGGYIILDYGKEMNGGIRILTFLTEKARVRIRFGESLTECCSEIGGEKNATNDHALRDLCIELQDYSDMTFGNTGFRFVRIDFYGEAKIKSVVAVNHIYKGRVAYRYQGKDKLIKKIYEESKRTIDLCAGQDYLWDGVKRDRLVWVGDSHPEMLALTTLYGKSLVLERSLNFVKEQTPLPNWMNNMPMYSMWWIIILADYYKKTGALDYLAKQIDYLEDLVKLLSDYVGENGELKYSFLFVDWPTSSQPDEEGGVRAINIIAMKKAIEVLDLFKRDTTTARQTQDRLLKKKSMYKKASRLQD